MKACLVLAALFGYPAFAQSTVAGWFPTHIGDHWAYEHETRENNGRGQASPEVRRWTSEQTITAVQTIPEGALVSVVTMPKGLHDPTAYLIRGDRVYILRAAWGELSANNITTAYHDGLAAGQISPDFCFPIGAAQNTFHTSKRPSSGTTADIWFKKGVGIVREKDIHHGTIGEERIRLIRFTPVSPAKALH